SIRPLAATCCPRRTDHAETGIHVLRMICTGILEGDRDRPCITTSCTVTSAPRPPAGLLADITEHRAGKLHLCAIKDVYSNRIVGYSINSRMKSSLAVAALTNAVALRAPVSTIVHSDRGSHFRPREFVHALSHNGLPGSMGRVGARGHNAAMEL